MIKNIILGLVVVAVLISALGTVFFAQSLKSGADELYSKTNEHYSSAVDAIDSIDSVSPSNTAYTAAFTQMNALQTSADGIKAILDNLTKAAEELKKEVSVLQEGIRHGNTVSPFYIVTSFGATPDDAADDTFGIQTALDESKDGGLIYFPKGTYLTSNSLRFYSNQILYFAPGATLKRNRDASIILLQNYTTADKGEYSATQNVMIIGATLDGNAEMDASVNHIAFGHSSNITVRNCVFRNGNIHYMEINSSEHVTIENCIFENSYYNERADGTSEYVQIDLAVNGAYGSAAVFKHDGTVCRNITIKNCRFELANTKGSAIGNHNDAAHSNIRIYDNLFIGSNTTHERGAIYFSKKTLEVDIYSNTFSKVTTGVNARAKLTDMTVFNNVFIDVSTPYTANVIGYNNIVDSKLKK